MAKRVDGKAALKKLQGLLGCLKIDPRVEKMAGVTIAFMSSISSALAETDEGSS